MENFFIDKLGNNDEGDDQKNEKIDNNENDVRNEIFKFQEIDLLDKSFEELEGPKPKLKKNIDINLNNTYLITNYKHLKKDENLFSNVEKLLENSAIQKGFEKMHSVPPEKSSKALKMEKKSLREKTKGKQWFDMPATELTEEIKNDFELLKMRSVLDRKHVYKKNDIKNVPKYFQVGKVVESPADFYSGRIPKSLRKRTIVDELLADAEFKKYQKKKFKEIMDENRRKKRTVNNKTENKMQKNKKFKR